MENLELYITQDHIDRGIRGSMCACPIAESLKERFPGSPISVTGGKAFVGSSKYYLDNAGERFVRTFDDEGYNAVKPTKVTLVFYAHGGFQW
jgi:hypothetical protein